MCYLQINVWEIHLTLLLVKYIATTTIKNPAGKKHWKQENRHLLTLLGLPRGPVVKTSCCHARGTGSMSDGGTRSHKVHSTLKTYFKKYTANNSNTDSFVNSLSIFWKQMPPAKHLQDTSLMNTYEQLSSKAVKDTGSPHMAVLSRGTLVSEHLLLIIDWDFSMALFQVFQVAYVIIKAANAPRPGNWILERSVDGVKFSPWQYYAVSDTECLTHYNITPRRGPPTYRADDEVICTSYYSRLVPLEHGEVRRPLPAGRSVFPHLQWQHSCRRSQSRGLKINLSWCRSQRSLTIEILELRYHCLLSTDFMLPPTHVIYWLLPFKVPQLHSAVI